MSLPGKIGPATPCVLGFDSDSIISANAAQQFYQQGYRFCIRYLSLGTESDSDLTSGEAAGILQAGLALMPVQHVRTSGWSPTESLGQQDGQQAVANAQQVGFPTGVNIWCDLEGVNTAAVASDVLAYCNAWYDAVQNAGFIPGLYVGSSAILNGQQLYSLPFQHYWQSQSIVPELPARGYQLIQLYPTLTLNGISVDVDVTQNDHAGGQAQWLVQS